MWSKSATKSYLLDVFNVGQDYDGAEFQCRFNPRHPVVALKFLKNLWLICLPGRRRDTQGQIIYHLRLDRGRGPSLESCQWSPDGKFLLLLKKDRDSVMCKKRDSAMCNGGWDARMLANFPNYTMLLHVFRLKDHRCKYLLQEIQPPQCFAECLDPFLLSSAYIH